MLRFFLTTILFFVFTFLGNICHSQSRIHLKNNEHDKAVRFASNRLDGKKQRTKHVKKLEAAFAQANQVDLELVDSLKSLDTPIGWERIHAVHLRMQKRHEKVEPLLPLVSNDGYRPDIRLFPVHEMVEESRLEVIERYFAQIEENMELARTGRRLAARNAYDRIHHLQQKYGWYDPTAKQLADEALALGRTYVLFEMGYRWDFYNSHSVMRYLESRGVASDATWQVVHFNAQPGIQYDFKAMLELLEASVSANQTSTTHNSYSTQIEVGKEEVKDTNGVVISSLPIYETISATVEEVRAWKGASLSAQLEVFDVSSGELVLSQRICESENYAASSCSVSGDARAFTGCCIGGIIIFPSDAHMLDECASDLRNRLGHLVQQVDFQE